MSSIAQESQSTTPRGRLVQKLLRASLAATIPGYWVAGMGDIDQLYIQRLAVGCLFYQAILLLLSSREGNEAVYDLEHKYGRALITEPLEHPPFPYAYRKPFIFLPCVFAIGWIVSFGFNAAMVARIHTAGVEVGLRGISIILTVISAENVVAFGALAFLCAKERRRLMDGGGLAIWEDRSRMIRE